MVVLRDRIQCWDVMVVLLGLVFENRVEKNIEDSYLNAVIIKHWDHFPYRCTLCLEFVL